MTHPAVLPPFCYRWSPGSEALGALARAIPA